MLALSRGQQQLLLMSPSASTSTQATEPQISVLFDGAMCTRRHVLT